MKSLCLIRDIYRSIREFEIDFQQKHNLCLNEGMLLCSLKSTKLSSGEIAEKLGLTNSNASKVIRSVEDKGFVERHLGEGDKRQMHFLLTSKGEAMLQEIGCEDQRMNLIINEITNQKEYVG
jgi:DNA-binding MarR family transcriptional regulator